MTQHSFIKKVLATTLTALSLTACMSDEAKDFSLKVEVESTAASANIPGMILFIDSPDYRFLHSAGVANLETQEPLQTDDRMPVASAGKPLIAWAAALAHVEGLLDLDSSIENYLPEDVLAGIENSESITTRQLLNHTSGIVNYMGEDINESGYVDLVLNDPYTLRTDSDFIHLGLGFDAVFNPGTSYHYSNTGYLLVGMILDGILGSHHSAALREYVLEPMEMHSTYYKGIEQYLGDFVSGYAENDNDELIDVKYVQENIARANAPVVSNVEDLSKLIRNMGSNDGIMSDELSIQIYGSESLIQLDDNLFYGLGIHFISIKDQNVFFHHGREHGYSSFNYYVQDTDTTISALFNCGEPKACEDESEEVMERILHYVLDMGVVQN